MHLMGLSHSCVASRSAEWDGPIVRLPDSKHTHVGVIWSGALPCCVRPFWFSSMHARGKMTTGAVSLSSAFPTAQCVCVCVCARARVFVIGG